MLEIGRWFVGLMGLRLASRVLPARFYFRILYFVDRLLTSFNLHIKMSHMIFFFNMRNSRARIEADP